MPLLLGENHRVGVNRQPGVPGVDSAEVLSGGVGHGSGQVRTVLRISCVDTAGSAAALCPIDIPSEALTPCSVPRPFWRHEYEADQKSESGVLCRV